MFSSIETDKRSEVIKQCYWPLLQMAEDGFTISIEATAITLEVINDIDPEWIATLRQLIAQGKIEFIGSGYSQIIAPIVPEMVNVMNLRIGALIYEQLIGIRPTVYLINEMAVSTDVISLYLKEGVESIVFEWNNFYKYSEGVHKDFFRTPVHLSNGKSTIRVIWADSILFQKFQRCVHGEIETENLISFLTQIKDPTDEQFIPIYSSDAEIFNFRPGRYKTENNVQVNEWERVRSLYTVLGEIGEFVFMRDIVSAEASGYPFIEFKPKFPIQVKKQEKYNIFRWAIGGRDNLRLNADCYRIYEHLMMKGSFHQESWKSLLLYWSSDFRTHITIDRFREVKESISTTLQSYGSRENFTSKSGQKAPSCSVTDEFINIESQVYNIKLNRKKGLVIDSFQSKNAESRPIIGKVAHGTYDDITFGNDYLSGYAICYDGLRKQHTHLFDRKESIQFDDDRVVIRAENNCNEKFIILDVITATSQYFEIDRRIRILDQSIDIVHPFVFTFLPEKELREMTYSVCNGSKDPVSYPLENWALKHQQSKYLSVSAIHGFTPTNGNLVICDSLNSPQINFYIDNTCAPLVCSFQYDGYVGLGEEHLPFCWLVMSAQEINDAYKGNDERKENIHCKLRIY